MKPAGTNMPTSRVCLAPFLTAGALLTGPAAIALAGPGPESCGFGKDGMRLNNHAGRFNANKD
jgi:hypothetical protein